MGRNNHALVTGLFLIVLVTSATAFIYWIGTMNKERNLYVISTRNRCPALILNQRYFSGALQWESDPRQV